MFHLLFNTYTCIPYKTIDRTSLINSKEKKKKKKIVINCRDRKIPKRKKMCENLIL